MNLKAHIFVCTNERAPGHPKGCCKGKGSETLLESLKQELSKTGIPGIRREVRAQKAGCLGVCEYGPAMVIYPEGIWYGNVTLEDISEIVKSHIIEGKPVKRLMISKNKDNPI